MSLSPIFQRDLFGADSGLSGWPSDGLDDPPAPALVADLRTSSARALRVALGLPPSPRQGDVTAPAVPSAPPGGASAGE